MPVYNTRSARSSEAPYAPPKRRLIAEPHTSDFFWRLFGLFDRQSRPLTYDLGFDTADRSDGTDYLNIDRLSSSIADRGRRYDIFEEMDHHGLVSQILNVYAEEATQPDYDTSRRVWIESTNDKLQAAGEDCLRNVQLEDTLFSVTRRMCKYGDDFRRLLYSTEKGVLGWRSTVTKDVQRVEDRFRRLVGFKEGNMRYRVQKIAGTPTTSPRGGGVAPAEKKGASISYPWDYIHFRLLADRDDGYGKGLCEGMFREWRNMALSEDAMLMYRLRRAPDRNLIWVDVGNMEDHEAMRWTNRWRKRFRKYEFVDPATPDYRKQYNPLSGGEDIFLPTRPNSNNRVEQLSGSGNQREAYDIEHFRDAFFGSAGAPKAYFGFEGEINAKATLQQQDIRFARGAKRIQAADITGLRTLLDIHFVLLGEEYDPGIASNKYVVKMSPISYLDEFQRLELVQMRFAIVQTLSALAVDLQVNPRMWAIYLLLNYAKLPETMIDRLITTVSEKPATGNAGAAGPEIESLEKGVWALNKREQQLLQEVVDNSPALRQSLARFEQLGEAEREFLAVQQTDLSILPPRVQGIALEDSYTSESAEIREALEEVEEMRQKEGFPEKEREESRRIEEQRSDALEATRRAMAHVNGRQ